MFKPDKIQLRAEILKSGEAGAEYALVARAKKLGKLGKFIKIVITA